MKALAVLFFLLGVLALFWNGAPRDRENRQARAVAMNYAVWRNAVFLHVFAGHKEPGEIPLAALRLPEGWTPLRNWTARIENGRCYAYGPASAEEIAAARDIFHGSFAVGRAVNGHLVPGHESAVPVPGVPEDNLVTVVNVD